MKNISLILKMMKFWVQKKSPLFEIFMKGKRVLDMGCGEGNLLRKDKKNIYGIDINKTLIEKLQSEGLLVKYGDATKIPFEDDYFDVVHCRDVIEHLFPEQAHKMFLEMKRVLKQNGIIILMTPMPKIIWNTFGHVRPYPPAAIKKLFRETSRESFNSVSGLSIKNIICLRGSYLMIIQKT